jgi:4-hydroxy-3-methylbut-2-en-1-yl diphosphate synthase IspG/GcpE
MSFSRPLFILVASCLYASHTTAQNASEHENQHMPSLAIKPITCVVKSLGEACQMKANVTWQSPAPQSVCLYQDKQQLKCWAKQNQVSEMLNVTLEKTMVFSLRDKKQNTLVEQTIKVHALSSRKYRRKLKSDWSLF